ncbi:MAG: hypothetical protein U0166_14745 [Acidobacteriota bacterium]
MPASSLTFSWPKLFRLHVARFFDVERSTETAVREQRAAPCRRALAASILVADIAAARRS